MSNMQNDPLLERIDWFFTSSSWTVSYPSTFVYPVVKPTSEHLPCVIAIGTKSQELMSSDLKIIGCNIVISSKLCKMLGIFPWVTQIVQKG
jgi:hypothetical protein